MVDIRPDDRMNRSLSFNLTIDNSNNLIDYFSVFNMDEFFYETAKEKALAEKTSEERFKLEDTTGNL